MSGIGFTGHSSVGSPIAIGTGMTDLLTIEAADTNHASVIERIKILFDPGTVDDHVVAEVVVDDGTAPTTTALTLEKKNRDDDEAIQTEAWENPNNAGTNDDVVMRKVVHAQAGEVEFDFTFEKWGGFLLHGGDRLRVHAKCATAGVNAHTEFEGHE
jgi:hypothetical protein